MSVNRRKDEEGFTMIAVVLGLSLVVALSLVAVAAVSGDLHLTRNDLDRKRAYEAAKAGISDYLFHLQKETSYWTHCTNLGSESNAVNQVGSTAKRRPVPGNPPGAEYAIELLPAEGQTQYTQCDPTTATTASASMLQPTGLMKGTFRIRSTGFAGNTEVPIVATFKPATFLDYVWFTQRETLDPTAYGYPNPSPELTGVNSQCSKTLAEGRNLATIPNVGRYCVVIRFVQGDSINGPMHTNDAFVICESPTLGRGPADAVEVSGPPKGWFSSSEINGGDRCTGSSKYFLGTFTANAPAINPPPSNAALKSIAEANGTFFKGQVRICLSGNTIAVSHGASCTEPDPNGYSGQIPPNGVVYVAHNESCSTIYSPFTATYPATSTCGNAFIHGENYSGQLTLATENDIIIDGNLTHTGEGVLGLVANNFVRVYHNYPSEVINSTSHQSECKSGEENGLKDLRIDAAILAINHSFIVDHYDCGAVLGTLTVNGSIAQKYRGPVGTGGNNPSSGYLKNYSYDDRLRYLQPPSFIQPKETDWVIGRETLG
jgi:Tfp pilus assembly protein PilX